MTGEDRGISALERIEAILASTEIHELAAVVPTPPRDRGGRPRHYPVFMVIVYESLIGVFGSARQVEAELAHPTMWRWVRNACKASTGLDLPQIPMRRHHYLYLRNRYLTDPQILELLGEVHRRSAATQAQRLGLLRADGDGSWTHPSLDRVVYGDGKVITPLYRARPGDIRLDRSTGKLRRLRAEPDADLHFEGTGETVWGTKFVIFATRGQTAHSRIILDVDFVANKGGEAATAMSCLARTTPHLPGAQAVVYDTALRGVHHQTILRQLGLVPINRVAAAKASSKKPRRDAKEQRVEKTVFVETKELARAGRASTRVDLYARPGSIGIGTLTADGELHFTPLPRVRTHRNASKNGYRWYNDYRLPDHLGAATVTVRLHANDDDTARNFNRTENVRVIAPDDPGFTELFRRRNDAESINRAIDDTLWLRRAHSLGRRRQLLNMIGYALMVNALAAARHKRQTLAA